MLPKLHLIASTDELRPAYNCIQISKKDLRSTDGTCLAIIPTRETILDPEQLPEEPLYLHRESYKLLTVSSITAIIFNKEKRQFTAIHKGLKPSTIIPVTELDERYPDFEPILPNRKDYSAMSVLGINPFLLAKLAEAIALPGVDNKSVAVEFYGGVRPVRVFPVTNPEAGIVAIIMPVHIQSEYILGI
jgi:hypothetical protein